MIYAVVFFILCGILIGFMYVNAHVDHLAHMNVDVNKYLPKEQVNIFFISDVHNRLIKEKTIAKIQEKLDVIVIGGDLIERNVSMQKLIKNLQLLKKLNAPMIFVYGNNDKEILDPSFTKILDEEGVITLCNTQHTLSDKIVIAGYDYIRNHHTFIPFSFVGSKDELSILVAHDPKMFSRLSNEQLLRFDFGLAGHTHGGQIRIGPFGFYTRGGWFNINRFKYFVTEGYGYTLLPLRLFTRSECHVLRIKSTLHVDL